jgi:hypothetical protein
LQGFERVDNFLNLYLAKDYDKFINSALNLPIQI